MGATETSADLRVQSKKSIILESQMPGGVNMDKLRELENPNVRLPEEKPVVKMAPRFITQLNQQVQSAEGDTIHVECRVEPLDCQIEWYFNGQPLRSGGCDDSFIVARCYLIAVRLRKLCRFAACSPCAGRKAGDSALL